MMNRYDTLRQEINCIMMSLPYDYNHMLHNIQDMLPKLLEYKEWMMLDKQWCMYVGSFKSSYEFISMESTKNDIMYISDRWNAPYRVQFLIDFAKFGYLILTVKHIIQGV